MPAKYGAFANKMTGRAASAAAAATTNVIISLPVDQIDENPLNEQVFSMNGISSLAERMKKKGDTSPIRVRRKEDGRYEVEEGHRRLEEGKVEYTAVLPLAQLKEEKQRKVLKGMLTLLGRENEEITATDIGKLIAATDTVKKEDIDDLKKIRDAIEEIIKVKLQDTGK